MPLMRKVQAKDAIFCWFMNAHVTHYDCLTEIGVHDDYNIKVCRKFGELIRVSKKKLRAIIFFARWTI